MSGARRRIYQHVRQLFTVQRLHTAASPMPPSPAPSALARRTLRFVPTLIAVCVALWLITVALEVYRVSTYGVEFLWAGRAGSLAGILCTTGLYLHARRNANRHEAAEGP